MSIIYEAGRSKPIKLPVVHDPDSAQFYGFQYRAPLWGAGKIKIEAFDSSSVGDTVVPTTPTGFYAKCISSGLTGGTEPTWPTVDGEKVTDGSVEWEMVFDNQLLREGDSINTSSWASDITATLSDDGILSGETFVKVSGVDSAETAITLTNTIDIVRQTGRTETIERSMTIKIKDQ